MQTTTSSRILDPTLDSKLEIIAKYLSRLERLYFVDRYVRGREVKALKKAYIELYGITARQFNAIRISVDGMVTGYREGLKGRIEDLQNRIACLKRKVADLEKTLGDEQRKPDRDLKRCRSLRFTLHQKKRRLAMLQSRLAMAKQDLATGKVRFCFGGRKLFGAQNHLKQNRLASHRAWRVRWRQVRGGGFFCLGSKGETAGNQTCVINQDLSSLRLRIPPALVGELGGTYLSLPVRFSYGREQLVAALRSGQAISYRICRGKKDRWYVHASTERIDLPLVTHWQAGAIGVDLNADHVAIAETDRFGNPAFLTAMSLVLWGRRSQQVLAQIGEVCARIVQIAFDASKPLVIEALDFAKKKARLREMNPKQSRKLSSFAYRTFDLMLHSRAQKAGVEVIAVNPAFTSIIGEANWQQALGISVHTAAALAIARRGLLLRETPKRRVASVGPARIRSEKVWRWWGRFLARRRQERARSRAKATRLAVPASPKGSKAGLGGNLRKAGGIPAASRESCSPGEENSVAINDVHVCLPF
ncbi:MAG: IS200/IS605 family element transposase accessory protein TnpB [Candidatus Schekmanbacteria bacterium]|nr:IS200/IS605 family element transposase accessory protein TnpB [Candidatus Schekmanbacteria bacterium]